MTQHPLLFHRSAAVCDWQCPRKRFYNYEFLGRGIVPPESAYELYLGTLIHDGIAALTNNVPIDAIVEAGIKQLRGKLLEGREMEDDAQFFANEQCALAEGLLRGFYKARWPQICEEYPEVVVCEQELIYNYEIDGRKLRFLSKPDLVRRDREGQLWLFEWKTTSSNKEEWIHQWETAVQVHAQIRTVEEALGEPVAGCIVQGFYKGYEDRRWNRWESHFCYGYHKPGNPPFEREQWQFEYKYGFKKAPLWNREGGVKRWVEEMPMAMLSSSYPCTPPIFLKSHLVEEFFQQQGMRELDIREHRDVNPFDPNDLPVMRRYFPQHWEACNAWNRECGYKRLCHGAPVDPLTIGYQLRHSHHALEQEQFDAAVQT